MTQVPPDEGPRVRPLSARSPGVGQRDATAAGRRSPLGMTLAVVAVGVAGILAFTQLQKPAEQVPVVGDVSSTTTTAPTLSEFAVTDEPDLSVAFLAYMYPIDGEEMLSAWRWFDAPLQNRWNDAYGSCLRDAGYAGVASWFSFIGPQVTPEYVRFPNLPGLRESGFEMFRTNLGVNLLGALDLDPDVTDTTHLFVQLLANYPGDGVGASAEAASALATVMLDCVESNRVSETTDEADTVRAEWRREMDAIDTEPAVAQAIQEAIPCLNAIDPVFDDVENLSEWLERWNRERISREIDGLLTRSEFGAEAKTWGQSYAVCMAQVAEQREPLRIAARDEIIAAQGTLLEEFEVALLAEASIKPEPPDPELHEQEHEVVDSGGAAGVWADIPTGLKANLGGIVVAGDDTVLVIGGWADGSGQLVSLGVIVDLVTGEVSDVEAPLPVGSASGVWTGTEFVVIGGQSFEESSVAGVAIDPADGSWRAIADGPWRPANYLSSVFLDGYIYVWAPGVDASYGDSPSAAVGQFSRYSVDSDSWEVLTVPDESARTGRLVVVGDGLVVVLGEQMVPYSTTPGVGSPLVAYRYDISTGTWGRRSATPVRPDAAGVTAMGDEVVAVTSEGQIWVLRDGGWVLIVSFEPVCPLAVDIAASASRAYVLLCGGAYTWSPSGNLGMRVLPGARNGFSHPLAVTDSGAAIYVYVSEGQGPLTVGVFRPSDES